MSASQPNPQSMSLNELIRTEFDKLKDRESMIKQMFLSTLKQDAVKIEETQTNETPQSLDDRLKDRYECIVSNGLSVAFTEAKNKILNQLHEVHGTKRKRPGTNDNVQTMIPMSPMTKRRKTNHFFPSHSNGNHYNLRSHHNGHHLSQSTTLPTQTIHGHTHHHSQHGQQRQHGQQGREDIQGNRPQQLAITQTHNSMPLHWVKQEVTLTMPAMESVNVPIPNGTPLPALDADDDDEGGTASSSSSDSSHSSSESDESSDSDSDSDDSSDDDDRNKEGAAHNEPNAIDNDPNAITITMVPLDRHRSLWIPALKLRIQNDAKFTSFSLEERRRYLEQVQTLQHRWKLDTVNAVNGSNAANGSATLQHPNHMELIRNKAAQFYDFPKGHISVEPSRSGLGYNVCLRTVNVTDDALIECTDQFRQSARFSFRIYMPNEGRFNAERLRMPLNIIYSKDWTANEMIRSILNLAVDIPLIGYAFFADVIRYVMKYEMRLKSEAVDISVLTDLGPERFLIFSDEPGDTPTTYYQNDQHCRRKGKWTLSSIAFGIQFLPLDDPLVTGATVNGHDEETEAQGFELSLTRSLWISIRSPKNRLIGSVRCLLKKGQSLDDVCKQNGILTAKQFAIYRFSFPPGATIATKTIFYAVKPQYGYLTLFVSSGGKYFCKHLCGKEYVHNGKSLREHEQFCKPPL